MRFRNLNALPQTITVRLNAGEKVEGLDPSNNKIVKDAVPQLHTVHIPGLAEVEIEDKIWNLAWAQKSIVPIYEDEILEIDGEKEGVKHKVLTKTPTGKSKVVYPLRELVKNGTYKITVKPENKMTKKDIIGAIKKAGIAVSDDITAEKLFELYDKVVG